MLLAEAGVEVAVSSRREAQIHQVVSQIEALGRKTPRHPYDIGGGASIDKFRDAVVKEFAFVDILAAAAQFFR